MTDVLIVGESWVNISTHYKGFNHFVSGTYETGLRWFSEAMERHGLDVTHIPSHVAANDFPFTPDELDYDCIILSDVGADTFLLHPKTWLHGERTPNRLKALAGYV
ncbi:cytoplasmic protein, partial [Candidatus Bathyarchaeota archaeon]|nr:cytoplasmic protein [Candidatus Bathyarchaeota archaeon]